MSVNTTDPMIGRLVDGRYQVRSRIARGGMATVYLATDLRLERRVAIKVMHGHLADDSAFKQRFIQEARSAARLAHPNVVNVFDQGQDDDYAYLVMEYLPGITLRELLQEYGSLTPEQTIDIAEAVLSGLAAAHKAGIVHRDLKPENVLLADDGRIKIGDFGLARAATANTATGAALLGTIAYLSPELVTRGIADTRSDIYAVGIMMFEMLTGEQPFTGEQPMQIAYQHANDAVPAPSTRNAAVPAELDELVLWATERDPERRPHDARELLEQLHAAEAELRGAGLGATAAQRTMVLPAAPAAPRPSALADAETQLLGARGATGPQPEEPGAADRLADVARRRRRRGPIIAILVVLLAAIAGTTGWYFGAGPGALATIPAGVLELEPEAAAELLVEAGFTVAPENAEAHSLEVAEGLVMQTDPEIGTSVRRGSEVQLVVSLGPREIELEPLAGREAEELIAELEREGLRVPEPIEQFSRDVEAGLVISARDLGAEDGEGADLSEGGTTLEGREIELVVSVGGVPGVAGETVETATSRLAEVGLTVDSASEQRDYSDEVEEGRVIGLVSVDGPRRPGQSVSLVISRGPQLFELPDVVGDRIADAVAELRELGFEVEVRSEYPEDVWGQGFARVTDMEPEAGTEHRRGTTIILRSFV